MKGRRGEGLLVRAVPVPEVGGDETRRCPGKPVSVVEKRKEFEKAWAGEMASRFGPLRDFNLSLEVRLSSPGN
jgi:hypothetical protein